GNPTGIYCEGGSLPVIGGVWYHGNDIYSNTTNFGVQNTGAAWGMLEGLNHWLVPLSLVMLVLQLQ
ncbi:MAG: hypothetical protein HGB05_22610, partial [Chloroflexi bacterium]|nr:hypothetical protein [Chloroflexota bacterium]